MATETETRPLFIRLTLPNGLEEALEGLAREVLRSQPDNILEFAANHFEQLVKTRGSALGKGEMFFFALIQSQGGGVNFYPVLLRV